jgi:DNA-binding NarL/FixJ family response regulator
MNQGDQVWGEAESGHDGMELAKRLKPDIVLLDYAMPNMNGWEAARLISASMPQCGLIMFTMFASDELCIWRKRPGSVLSFPRTLRRPRPRCSYREN